MCPRKELDVTPPISQKASNQFADLAAAVGALVASVLMTWPLAVRSWDHVLEAIYYWDAYCNTMILGSRVDAALGQGPLNLWENYFFAPLPRTIVFNENHFGLSLLFAPFYLISQNPLWAYNVVLLLSLASSVFFTYLLVRRLTGSGLSAFLAGITFAFCPYVFFEIGRIQLVATQWIPALFLFLHRIADKRRSRDIVGFWLVYLLQVGTCLYYAMFLVPLLGIASFVLLTKQGLDRALLLRFVGGAIITGAIALAMVYPYFAARHDFSLERALDFAASYDGRLEFFTNVHPTNRTLTGLHHTAQYRGAYEEIAFPGFTVGSLATVAIGHFFLTWRRKQERLIHVGARWLGLLILSALCMLMSHSMLVGLVVFGLGFSALGARPQSWGPRKLYLGLAACALLMFLGLYPLDFKGQPVHGLYYYFHTYFPGFNGIRKVSRQAIMVTFALCVLSGFGGQWVLNRFREARVRFLVFSGLLIFAVFELRTFPHPLKKAWAAETVPDAFAFMRELPEEDIVASIPQDRGQSVFRGDAGMAYHDYLSLYHKHKFANGQSSYLPQVTDLVRRSLQHLPDPGAIRMLDLVGVRHLYVHGADLPGRQLTLIQDLNRQSGLFRPVFQQGTDAVFSLKFDKGDKTREFVFEPELPSGARAIPREALRPMSSLEQPRLRFAIDGSLDTHWSTRRPQKRGHFFQLKLDRLRPLTALEIRNPKREMYLPLSYKLSVKGADDHWRTVLHEPQLRLFHGQVYSPKGFVYRLVLPEVTEAKQIRLTIDAPLPGYDFVIHEIQLFEAK